MTYLHYRFTYTGLLVAVAIQTLVTAETKFMLKQVVVISRHGSRGFLTKHHTTFKEGENSELTVRGMDQMFQAGQYVRNRYEGSITTFLSAEYNSSEVYVRSSDYPRTLSSAQSFLLGLYPPRKQVQETNFPGKKYLAPYDIQQVPIHTVAVDNDQLLRGWLQCPTFQDQISEFYGSEMFKKKEKDNTQFMKSLEPITGMESIALKNFYNVYDFIHLHIAYGRLYLNITDKQWNKVTELADWLEYQKYNRNRIHSMGAGLLLNEIILSFRNTKKDNRKAKLLYYSAHYPTIISLFSLLGVNEANIALQTIPYYASLVFLELYQANTGKNPYYVKFAFRNGLQNDTGRDTFQYFTIPGCGSDMCSLEKFVGLFGSLKAYDKRSWCNQCNNVHLSTCQPVGKPYKRITTMTAVGGFFTGFFVCLLIVIVFMGIWHFCIKKRLNRRPRHGLPDFEHHLPGVI